MVRETRVRRSSEDKIPWCRVSAASSNLLVTHSSAALRGAARPPIARIVSPRGHARDVDLSLAVSAFSAVVSLGSLIVSARQHLWARRLDRTAEATDAVVDAIQDLRTAVWAAARQDPDPEAISERISSVDRECRRYAGTIPALGAVGHSVREAAGNYLGGAAGYALSPHLRDEPRSPHDPYWWDISITYLDYVVRQLASGKLSPKRGKVSLTPFHEWRRAEDEGHHAALKSPAAEAEN